MTLSQLSTGVRRSLKPIHLDIKKKTNKYKDSDIRKQVKIIRKKTAKLLDSEIMYKSDFSCNTTDKNIISMLSVRPLLKSVLTPRKKNPI